MEVHTQGAAPPGRVCERTDDASPRCPAMPGNARLACFLPIPAMLGACRTSAVHERDAGMVGVHVLSVRATGRIHGRGFGGRGSATPRVADHHRPGSRSGLAAEV